MYNTHTEFRNSQKVKRDEQRTTSRVSSTSSLMHDMNMECPLGVFMSLLAQTHTVTQPTFTAQVQTV